MRGMGENDKVKRDETVRHRALSRHSLPTISSRLVPVSFGPLSLRSFVPGGARRLRREEKVRSERRE